MALQRVELNSKAVAALLKSPAVRADLERRAKAIAQAAGDGNEADSHIGSARARAVAYTATPAAMRRESEQRALLRAVDAGRR